jgi:hypothetical protein
MVAERGFFGSVVLYGEEYLGTGSLISSGSGKLNTSRWINGTPYRDS